MLFHDTSKLFLTLIVFMNLSSSQSSAMISIPPAGSAAAKSEMIVDPAPGSAEAKSCDFQAKTLNECLLMAMAKKNITRGSLLVAVYLSSNRLELYNVYLQAGVDDLEGLQTFMGKCGFLLTEEERKAYRRDTRNSFYGF